MQNQTNYCNNFELRYFLVTIFLLGVVFLSQNVFAQQATARIDRTVIGEHDTVTLRYSVNEPSPPTPDFSVLRNDFEILQNNQSTSITSVNGRNTATSSWTLVLAPKRLGTLTIPAIKAGSLQSQPLQLTVQKVAQPQAGGPAPDIFLEAEATPNSPYVQSQLIYTLRLFHSVPLISGQLSEPTIAQATVHQLGDAVEYQTQRHNRTYRVIERRYVIFPETAGTLEIPPMAFTGKIPSAQSRRGSVFDNFFNSQGHTVRHQSNPVKVNVKSPDAAFQGNWWLPAQDVEITQSWSPNPPVFKVGEPVTRTIMLKAKGIMDTQLPEIAVPDLPDLRAYPDQAQTETQTDGQSLYAVRREKIAIVPGKAGQYTLPPVRIPWWDVANETMRYAELPEQIIEVQGAPITQPAPNVAAPQHDNTTETDALPVQAIPAETVYSPGFWPWLSALLALAWMATLAGWWYSLKTSQSNAKSPDREAPTPSVKAARRELEQACRANEPRRTQQALLAWAKARWPDALITSTGHLSARLNQPEATVLLGELDAVLYREGSRDWQGEAFWQALSPHLDNAGKSAKAADKKATLQPLYPHAVK